MKNKISYVLMSLSFFNILFIFYYYFKIVSFFYVDLFNFHIILNTLLINGVILVVDILYIFMYQIFNLYKLSYFKITIIGCVLGILMSILFLRENNYEFADYLSFVSYFMINTVFISYSLYFEKEKKGVFE